MNLLKSNDDSWGVYAQESRMQVSLEAEVLILLETGVIGGYEPAWKYASAGRRPSTPGAPPAASGPADATPRRVGGPLR